MHAARAKVALSKIYRYSLLDANGDNTGIEVLCVAEYIAYTLQIGWKPDIRIEYPCGKCEKIRCIGKQSCEKGKTVYYVTGGKYSNLINKTCYDFANYLIDTGLTTFEAVQQQISNEKIANEIAVQEAARIKEEQETAMENEAKAEANYKNWLNEAVEKYGMSVSGNEKILILTEIFQHLANGFHNRAIRLLVLIDNIDNPRCRRDIIFCLYNDNVASIKTFEHITGIKLAKTYKERKAQLETITQADYGKPKQYKPRKDLARHKKNNDEQ